MNGPASRRRSAEPETMRWVAKHPHCGDRSNRMATNFDRKRRYRVRSKVMGKFCVASAYGVGLVLWLVVARGSTHAQTTTTGDFKIRGAHKVLSCKKDSQCPSGQRCGFTFGCESKGKCIVPSRTNHCIDPGGRCGCDGRPVEIFCEVGSRTELASAPVDAVGPCPRPCTDQSGCGSRLVCKNGFCVTP
jgi:hypothetical protein